MKIYALKRSDSSYEFIQSNRNVSGGILLPPEYTWGDTYYMTITSYRPDPIEETIEYEDGTTEVVLVEQPLVYEYHIDETKREFDKAIKKENEDKEKLKSAFVSNIYNRMYEVFKTKDPNSASAYLETWKHMQQNPELYIDKDLEFDETIESYNKGQMIDTVEKAVSYSTFKIAKAFEYGIWRMKVIQDFDKGIYGG